MEIVAVLEVPISGAKRRCTIEGPVLTMGLENVIQSGSPETAHKHDELVPTLVVRVPPELGTTKARELSE